MQHIMKEENLHESLALHLTAVASILSLVKAMCDNDYVLIFGPDDFAVKWTGYFKEEPCFYFISIPADL